jgi:nucleoid-associated protein YgaU
MGEPAKNTVESHAADKATAGAGRSRAMGKETKVGLAVIGVLLVVFAGVLIVRLRNSDPARKPGSVVDLVGEGEQAANEEEAASVNQAANAGGEAGPGRAHAPKAGERVAANGKRQGQAWSSRKATGNSGETQQQRFAVAGANASRQSGSSRRAQATAQDAWSTDDNGEPSNDDEEPFDPTDESWAWEGDTQKRNAQEDGDQGDAAAAYEEEEDAHADDQSYTVRDGPPSIRRTTGGPASQRRASSANEPPSGQLQPMPADDWSTYEDEQGYPEDATEQDPADFEPPTPNDGGRIRPAASRGTPAAGAAESEGTYGRPARPQVRGASADLSATADPDRTDFPQEETYTVQPNDNYWSISRAVYGTGAYFKALYEHNRDRFPYPDQLRAGDVIDTPPAAVLEQTYPDLCPQPRRSGRGGSLRPRAAPPRPSGRTYVVKEGDTLFDIARAELGRSSRWAELYELNRDQLGDDFDYLTPGMELLLPADVPGDDSETESESVTTQRPRRPYRR